MTQTTKPPTARGPAAAGNGADGLSIQSRTGLRVEARSLDAGVSGGDRLSEAGGAAARSPQSRRKPGIRKPASPLEALQPKPAPGPAMQNEDVSRMRRRRREERADEPRRGGGGLAGFISGLTKLVLLIAVLAGVVYFVFANYFDRAGPLKEQVFVEIGRGMGLATIADKLENEGIISDSLIFIGGVFLNNANGQLKAGEYAIPAEASMRTVMEILVEGKAFLYRITFPEGLTSFEIVQRLNADDRLSGEITAIPAEGTLLPETYSFPRNSTKAQVIEQMQEAHRKVITDAWENRASDLPISSPDEAMVLASIVEKETGQADERPLVASVFVNRLRRGMRLQSDPTIIYGITEGKGKLERPIFQSDIDRATPYNTYQIQGLPPTPIANPGKASIEATLNPETSDFLFFVADGTGGHAFASSLAEHTRNVARWRQIERKLREEEAARGQSPQAVPAISGAEVETETEDLPLPGQ